MLVLSMRYKFVGLQIIALFITFLSLSLLLNAPIYAQNAVDLTVSPPRQEINVKPGEQTRVQIKFINKSDENLSGFIKKADFLVLDKEGTPTLYDTSAANNRFSASTWLTPSEERVTIAAKNQYTSTVYINVPSDAYPCGHYASVYFEPAPPSLGGQPIKLETSSAVAFKLSSLIYFNVEGQCKENAFVSKIMAPQFMEYGPIPVEVEILNRSDYHIAPQAGLSLQNFFKQQTDVKVLPLLNIFPDTIRAYKESLGSKWMFGRYQVDIKGGYGKMGRSLTAFTYVWVIPWKIITIIILTLLVLFVIIKTIIDRTNKKEQKLEHEIQEEKAEIEKLREALKKRKD